MGKGLKAVANHVGEASLPRSLAEEETAGRRVQIYDTTLRDGSQGVGMALSVGDKLKIAEALDTFGVDYIEGGWPGANPKDEEFFERAKSELRLSNARLYSGCSSRASRSRLSASSNRS